MSERLNAILEKLSNLPQLESFGDTIEAIRATYDVDHVYYYAISLGLEMRAREGFQFAALPEADGVLTQAGRRLAAMSYSRTPNSATNSRRPSASSMYGHASP